MIENELNNRYFEWMRNIVNAPDAEHPRGRWCNYKKLLRYLHSVEFTYTIPMDGDRAEDGMNLRYRFGRECGYSDPMIANVLDIRPCSVLEMMVALALRCEEQTMYDPDIGDRTPQWFWGMITNLDLIGEYDLYFDERYVEYVIDRLLNREYKRNGDGGLFRINDRSKDMRQINIWYQMNHFLTEIL